MEEREDEKEKGEKSSCEELEGKIEKLTKFIKLKKSEENVDESKLSNPTEETILVKEEHQSEIVISDEEEDDYEIISTPTKIIRGQINYMTSALAHIDGLPVAVMPNSRSFRKCDRPCALKGMGFSTFQHVENCPSQPDNVCNIHSIESSPVLFANVK